MRRICRYSLRAWCAPVSPALDPQQGGVYVLSAEQMSPNEIDQLQTAARVILVSKHGSLSDHVVRLRRRKARPPSRDWRIGSPRIGDATALPAPTLAFFNGLGGFSEDGSEYVTVLSGRHHTPLPWANVSPTSRSAASSPNRAPAIRGAGTAARIS
jgi:cellobiose phosphorylase